MFVASCSFYFNTVPQAPTSVPTVTSIGTTFLFLMWNALDCEKQNGPITHYIVEYTAGDTSLTASANTTLYNLTQLMSCTNYSIRVAAVNGAGIGGFSESVSAITKATGKLYRKEQCCSSTCMTCTAENFLPWWIMLDYLPFLYCMKFHQCTFFGEHVIGWS